VTRLAPAAEVLVIAERAESVGHVASHRGQWDAVIARSFGAPAVTAECAAPLLVIGGVLVVAEPPSGSADRWPADGLARLGLSVESLVHTGDATYQVLRQVSECPARFPRRVGVPAKRPLF
jgi:16S rRNA (guanine527-N7)-methyltransferase